MHGNNGHDRDREHREELTIRKLYFTLKKIVNIRGLVKGSDDYKQRPKKRQ